MENWQRLEQVIKWAGMSVNAFALNLGLKRSENLYQIKKGNHGISKELANIISEKYPVISKSWLLTGEGQMLRDSEPAPKAGQGVPFYNIDIASVKELGAQQFKPIYRIDIPIFSDCNFAALSTSTAMAPEIPSGAIVVLKEQAVENLLPGESYLVITEAFSGIRTIRRSADDPSYLRLVPKNLADYDEIRISPADIKALYQVKGIVISKAM